MNAPALGRLLNALPDAYLLLRLSGRVEAANPAALRLLGTPSVTDGPQLSDLLHPSAPDPTPFLGMCSRSGSLLPGTLQLRGADGGMQRVRAGCAVVEPGEDPLLLVRLQQAETASRQFLVLNERITQLNREIQQRQRAQEQLQDQAMELEHLAAELEQTVEELQEQSESAAAAQLRAELSAERFRTLADAGAALAGAMDAVQIHHELARAAVQSLADYCVTYALTEQGQLLRVGAAHTDPARQPLMEQLVSEYPAESAGGGVAALVVSGEAVLAQDVTDAMLAGAAADERHLQLLRELAPTSSIVVPLQARGRTLGALAVARSGGRMHFNDDDLSLVQELSRRAALVLDNVRLLDDAQRGSRAKSAFLATMSHELRTPLNAIVGYADLLDAEVGGPLLDGQRQQLSRIRSAADHLRSIIDEILSFARIEANKEQLRIERVSAVALALETAELMRPTVNGRGLELAFTADDEFEIDTDAGKLKQILLNLLGNAVKFTTRGSISVSVRRHDDNTLITVSDTGIGIPADDVSRIFEPFWQVDDGMTRHAGGTGLGLTVSRRLAELMGGDIVVESAPGRGSSFTVILPMSPPAGAQ